MQDLEKKIGLSFYKERHGTRHEVELKEVRRDRVKVCDIHSETCTVLPTPQFLKFYQEL